MADQVVRGVIREARRLHETWGRDLRTATLPLLFLESMLRIEDDVVRRKAYAKEYMRLFGG